MTRSTPTCTIGWILFRSISSPISLTTTLTENEKRFSCRSYVGFEAVGSLGFSLVRADTQITADPGDVMLYSGNQIVIFFGSNTWAYTRLG
ncbi:MAG: hypothetical protein J1F33_04890 [Clostridiales bacterium]|nr:hypothetical protein [Clostridiales bacterium]